MCNYVQYVWYLTYDLYVHIYLYIHTILQAYKCMYHVMVYRFETTYWPLARTILQNEFGHFQSATAGGMWKLPSQSGAFKQLLLGLWQLSLHWTQTYVNNTSVLERWIWRSVLHIFLWSILGNWLFQSTFAYVPLLPYTNRSCSIFFTANTRNSTKIWKKRRLPGNKSYT